MFHYLEISWIYRLHEDQNYACVNYWHDKLFADFLENNVQYIPNIRLMDGAIPYICDSLPVDLRIQVWFRTTFLALGHHFNQRHKVKYILIQIRMRSLSPHLPVASCNWLVRHNVGNVILFSHHSFWRRWNYINLSKCSPLQWNLLDLSLAGCCQLWHKLPYSIQVS